MNRLRASNLTTCINILEKMDEYDQLRYDARPFLINTRWYGVPQCRTRVFIVGIKRGELDDPSSDVLDLVQQHLSLLRIDAMDPAPW